MTLTEIYQHGFNAFIEDNDHNPYPRLSLEWASWLRGWNTAQFGSVMNAHPNPL